MRKVILTRIGSSPEGTFGIVKTDTGQKWCSGELPWRNNQPEKSCIPVGTYLCVWRPSEKFHECYHVTGVPERTMIEIHPANFMGDKKLGYKCDLLGCIAIGQEIGPLEGQKALLQSRSAISQFNSEMNYEDFELEICEGSI